MFSRTVWTALALAAGLILIEAVDTPRTNPAPTGDVSAQPEVAAILHRACYDCHSDETRWPWYSRFAPASWMVAHDVERGRMELNFSEWNSYRPLTRERKLEWMGRAVRDEAMPPWPYRMAHPGARLTPTDRELIEHWAAAELSDSSGHP